jgi:RNA polymerase primary sigma factor
MASRSDDRAFDAYLGEIRRTPLLKPEEERALATRVQNQLEDHQDAEEAKHALIKANLRLVISVAKRYVGRGLSLPDLVEEGNVGLVHAAGKFDPTLETRFSTYATWWIKQAIRRSLMNTVKTVRVPSYLAEELQRWRLHAVAFERKHGRAPTDGELVAALEPAPGRTAMLLRLFHGHASSSPTVSLDLLFETVDAVVDARAERPDLIDLGAWEKAGLSERIGELPEREAAVIRLRFGLDGQGPPLTLREIGQRLELSRERARQLEHQALERLRAVLDRPSGAPPKRRAPRA